jgi:hypothetical protein
MSGQVQLVIIDVGLRWQINLHSTAMADIQLIDIKSR